VAGKPFAHRPKGYCVSVRIAASVIMARDGASVLLFVVNCAKRRVVTPLSERCSEPIGVGRER
jgi:hypothetical protein